MMKYAAGQRALDAGETECACVSECTCEFGHVVCVCVRVYNSFITLSAAAYAKPQRKTQWFSSRAFLQRNRAAL